MIKANEIPIELMRQRLRYDDGKLFWIDGRRAGKEAGCLKPSGYKEVNFNGKVYKVHRVIYSMFKGVIADGLVIDHKNQERDDNRIENLRAVSQSENMKNTGLGSNNTSGIKGVGWQKNVQKYVAFIRVNGKLKQLGYYTDKNEAIKARKEAEIKYANVKPATPTFSEHKVKKISIKDLKEQFDYSDGFLLRKTGRYAGKQITGSKNVYTAIMFNDKPQLAHRLIYAWHNGEIPKNYVIDHINGDTKDNRIENLRAVSRSQNAQNSKKRSNNKSGVVGVSFTKQNNKWQATITINGKAKHLGYYADINEAIKARKEAEIKHNYLVRAA